MCTTGLFHRSISSTATGMRDGSSTSSRRCSGCSISASVPSAIRLRVVSLPATSNRNAKLSRSSSVSRCSSISASANTDSRSLRGSTRRAAISFWKYSKSCPIATNESSSISGSAFPVAASDHARNCSQSSGGAPISSAIIRVGSGAAISSANSCTEPGWIPSRIPRTISRIFGSSTATRRRVKPELISLRSCRCRGGSLKIRLPSCTGLGIAGSGMVMPLVEENSAGLLDTKRMSSYFSSAQKLVTSFQHTGSVARSSR